MIKIGIADWLLSRSEAFRFLTGKFRDHKISTKQGFARVKQRHNLYNQKIKEHESRIKSVENIIEVLHEAPTPKIRKKKKNI